MEETILSTVSGLGFPALVCFYVLVKVNKTLAELANAINKLDENIDRKESEMLRKIDRMSTQIDQIFWERDIARRAQEMNDQTKEKEAVGK